MNKKLILWIFVLVLLSANVMAIGVSPGRTTIDFKPGSEHTVEFSIMNDQHKAMRVVAYIEGPLNQSVQLEEQLIEFRTDEERKSFKYTVKLPSTLPPGKNTASIVIREIPMDLSKQIGAYPAVITELVVNTPYPGKYLEIDGFEVSESEAGEITNFIIPVRNMGKDKLMDVRANIEILGPTNEVIDNIETETISLDNGKRELLKASWKADVKPGKYYAIATVNYDRESKKVDRVFNVGAMDIEVVKVETKNFKLGGVAKMDILLRSNWNEMIKDLYGEMRINNKEGDPVADIKTASIDLLPHSTKPIVAYWETAGLREGEYHIKLQLKFMDKVIEKQLVSYLSMDNMVTTLVSPTGQVIGGKSEIRKDSILSIAIIVLIILNISWFVYFKKMNKKK